MGTKGKYHQPINFSACKFFEEGNEGIKLKLGLQREERF